MPDSLSTAYVWIDGIRMRLEPLVCGFPRAGFRPVEEEALARWEATHKKTLPPVFRDHLSTVGAHGLSLGEPDTMKPLAEIKPHFEDRGDDAAAWCTVAVIASMWNGGDTHEAVLVLDGPRTGSIQIRSGGKTLRTHESLFEIVVERLETFADVLTLAAECEPRGRLEERCDALDTPARRRYCAAMCERALGTARRRWARTPAPDPEDLRTMETSLELCWRGAAGSEADSTDLERAHGRIEALRQRSIRERATALPGLEAMSTALAWTMVPLYAGGAERAPGFPVFRARSARADAGKIARIPMYVTDASDTVIGRTTDDWRATNREEIAWRQALLERLERGESRREVLVSAA